MFRSENTVLSYNSNVWNRSGHSRNVVRNTTAELSYSGESKSESFSSDKQNLKRIELLVLDYKQFKAARTIQRNFRGWRARKHIADMQKAAGIIQRAWRRYISRKNLMQMAQELAQKLVMRIFNEKSTKIQSFFRGWWSRKHVNNMLYLTNLQIFCVSEILRVMAYKMHRLMREGQLPGLMDFRDKQCLANLSDLMSSLTYRYYNRYVGNLFTTTKTIIETNRRYFRESIMWTNIPYPSFNENAACSAPPNWNIRPKIYGLREYDVAQYFLMANRKLGRKKVDAKPKNKKVGLSENELSFCKDLLHSIQYWKACPDCYKDPEKVFDSGIDQFLEDIKVQLETENLTINCMCRI